MKTVDLVIKNGTVYTENNFIECGLAIDDEKIVAIAKEANLPNADQVIDASGKFLLPGSFDRQCCTRTVACLRLPFLRDCPEESPRCI